MFLSSFRRSHVKRRVGLIAASAFFWSFVLATPAQLMAQSALHPAKRLGVRVLSDREMEWIVGRQGPPPHYLSYSPQSGSTFPWEGSVGGTNSGNGNKVVQRNLFGWTARGGMPVAFTLSHNSQSTHNSELGNKWTHGYDLYLAASGTGGNLSVHWGDDLSYVFTYNVDGTYSPPTGIHDKLVKNGDNTFTLTRPDQTAYHFKVNYYCDTISDENSNSVSLSYNSGNFVTGISDPSSRAISLTYDGSSRISTVTDPLNRVWTMHYTTGDLTSIDEPTINSTIYSTTVSYNSAHDITTLTSPGGRSQTFTYNSTDNSLASETDGCGNTSTWSYTSTATTISDANSHSTVHSYSNGRLASVTDAAGQIESYSWDSSNNRALVIDKRGFSWSSLFDSNGNVVKSSDPYTNAVTNTYNSHNRLLTSTDPLGHVTVTIVYDTRDNPTSITDALSHTVATTFTTYGLVNTTSDAQSHQTSFTYDADGNCTLVVDANSNQTSATFDGLSNRLTATDQLSHTTTWTLDAWKRVTSVATPAGTTSIAYNADSLVTSATDSNSHTVSQTFDNNGRPLVTTKANGPGTGPLLRIHPPSDPRASGFRFLSAGQLTCPA